MSESVVMGLTVAVAVVMFVVVWKLLQAVIKALLVAALTPNLLMGRARYSHRSPFKHDVAALAAEPEVYDTSRIFMVGCSQGAAFSSFSALCAHPPPRSRNITACKPPRYCWHLGCILPKVPARSLLGQGRRTPPASR